MSRLLLQPQGRMMKVGDFLTHDEIVAAVTLYKNAAPGTFARLCKEQIIEPNLKRIEEKLGQEMDAGYLAYAIEYALSQSL